MKKNSLQVGLLLIALFVFSACGSPDSSPKPMAQIGAARPPQTGTNLPRFVPVTETRPKTKPKTKRKGSATPAPAKKKPGKAAKRAPDEEVVTRGGFR